MGGRVGGGWRWHIWIPNNLEIVGECLLPLALSHFFQIYSYLPVASGKIIRVVNIIHIRPALPPAPTLTIADIRFACREEIISIYIPPFPTNMQITANIVHPQPGINGGNSVIKCSGCSNWFVWVRLYPLAGFMVADAP